MPAKPGRSTPRTHPSGSAQTLKTPFSGEHHLQAPNQTSDGCRRLISLALRTKTGFFNNPIIGKLHGHTQVQTLDRYAHLTRDTVKRSPARIGDSIEQGLHVSEVTRQVG